MATKATKRMIAYLVARLQEPSTIRGLILVATVFGAKYSEEMKIVILEFGLLLSGMLAVALPDKWKEKEIKPFDGSDRDYSTDIKKKDDEYDVPQSKHPRDNQ